MPISCQDPGLAVKHGGKSISRDYSELKLNKNTPNCSGLGHIDYEKRVLEAVHYFWFTKVHFLLFQVMQAVIEPKSWWTVYQATIRRSTAHEMTQVQNSDTLPGMTSANFSLSCL